MYKKKNFLIIVFVKFVMLARAYLDPFLKQTLTANVLVVVDDVWMMMSCIWLCFFQSRTHDSINHSVGRSVSPSVCRSITLYCFQPKSYLTSATAPVKCMRLMLSCIRPCFPFTGPNSRLVSGNNSELWAWNSIIWI